MFTVACSLRSTLSSISKAFCSFPDDTWPFSVDKNDWIRHKGQARLRDCERGFQSLQKDIVPSVCGASFPLDVEGPQITDDEKIYLACFDSFYLS